MKWQAMGLLATLFVSGCGESQETSDQQTLAVTFFGANLCTQSPLDTHVIPLKRIPPVSEAPGEFGMSRVMMIKPTEDNAERRTVQREGVSYEIARDSSGKLSVYAILFRTNEDSIFSRSVPLVPREGESGVFLLPDETHPKYAVCFVVTSALLSGPEQKEPEDAGSGSGNSEPSGGGQSGSSGASSGNTTPDLD
jgi:hypothetical protein